MMSPLSLKFGSGRGVCFSRSTLLFLRICFQDVMALVDQEMGTMIFGEPVVQIRQNMKFMQHGFHVECPQVAVVLDPNLKLCDASKHKMIKVRTRSVCAG